jgi:hypothetical protein
MIFSGSAMLPNSTRYRVDVDQGHSPEYRVSHHVGGAALALRGAAIPHGQHDVGEVHNAPACRKVCVLIRSRCVEDFDGRLLGQFTISRHMLDRKRPLDIGEWQHCVNRSAAFEDEPGEELIRTDRERGHSDERRRYFRKFGTQHPGHPRPRLRVIKVLMTGNPDPHFIGS